MVADDGAPPPSGGRSPADDLFAEAPPDGTAPAEPADGVEPRPAPTPRAGPGIGATGPVVALVILLGMAVFGGGIAVSAGGPPVVPAAPSASVPVVPAPSAVAMSAPATADLRATEVRLPTLGVVSALVGLDVGPDGALAPPPDPAVAGWYVRGSVPGEPGPTVVAGHVDSRSGPAVFYRLDRLAVGDRVEMARSDGRVFAYRVVTVERHPKDAFPTARVYGPTPGPELHLITCGGDFDRSSGHYRDNVVVTAVPLT